MAAYYNEIDPYAAEWLRNLIAAGHIAPGDVDERSIEDVRPDDLRGYVQCHFFAGIGVWSYALRLAGWPDDQSVWTGSCPCQPFSTAGKRVGFADERHLWPAWFHLIEQRRPSVVFGEQVEAAIRIGWLDLVRSDLEGIGYAFGAVGLPAAGVGAPHIRQRVWFVADADRERRNGQHTLLWPEEAGWLAGEDAQTTRCRAACSMAESSGGLGSATNGFWKAADWIFCMDGKWRPVEPGAFPLAHRPSARVGRLRAYGNAIVPQVAAEVIRAYIECRGERNDRHHNP